MMGCCPVYLKPRISSIFSLGRPGIPCPGDFVTDRVMNRVLYNENVTCKLPVHGMTCQVMIQMLQIQETLGTVRIPVSTESWLPFLVHVS